MNAIRSVFEASGLTVDDSIVRGHTAMDPIWCAGTEPRRSLHRTADRFCV
jgi:hypothetical protein